MSISSKELAPKIWLILAGGVVAISCTWCVQQEVTIRRIRSQTVGLHLKAADADQVLRPPINLATPVWAAPSVQSAGRGWVYELFSPPIIHYNAREHTYTVMDPVILGVEKSAFGLELLAVKPELYPLQLVGYVGQKDDYRATLTRSREPGVLFVRAGHHFADLGLTLTRFAVRKFLVETNETWPVYDIAAFAVFTEDQTGLAVELDSRRPLYTETPLAVVLLSAGGPPHELHRGDSLADAVATYLIESVQLTPPEVRVVRQIVGFPQAETRLLHPRIDAIASVVVPRVTAPHRPEQSAHDLVTP